MNLSVSNLAWDSDTHIEILEMLNDIGIVQIEGVPVKINSWQNLTIPEIINFKQHMDSKQIQVKSLQSIFYNSDIDNLQNYYTVIKHFEILFKLSKILGVQTIVFGSPGLRKKYSGWYDDLVQIFTTLDQMLDETSLQIVIEPNASTYGGEYFLTVPEIVEFITTHQFNNIKTMIDTHNVLLENQNPVELLDQYQEYITHIHVSEKNLAPFNLNEFHINFAQKLQDIQYKNIITYEVLPHSNFKETAQLFVSTYQTVFK